MQIRDGKKAHEKALNTISHWGNANESHEDIGIRLLQRPRIKPNNRNRKDSPSTGEGGVGGGLTLLEGGKAVLGRRGPSAQLEGLGRPGGGRWESRGSLGAPGFLTQPREARALLALRAARPHLLQVCVCLYMYLSL